MPRSGISERTMTDISGRASIFHAGIACGQRLLTGSPRISAGCLVTQLDTMEALRVFCGKYPSAKVGEQEYSFFMNGHAADYWIRFITRRGDYNLYLRLMRKGFRIQA